MLYRTVDGLPILDEFGCVQPVTAFPITDDPNFATVTNDVDGSLVSLIPLGGTGEEGEECDVLVTTDTDYSAFLQEVEFGRLAVARSPDRVLAQQLREVAAVLGSAGTISLDAAGRLVADGVEVDSPLQNLAIHQELQNFGGLTS